MSQKCYQFFIYLKLKKLIHFFTCILPNSVSYEIIKKFWKINHFENMTPGFLRRCQNSLRWEICLICHWNIDSWKLKRILKNKPFWKYDSWFSSEMSKRTSARNMLNLPLKYRFMEAKIVYYMCHCPKKWSKYPLDIIQTTFSDNYYYF